MNHKLTLVAALSLLSAAGAWAQSSVTVYGRMNLTLERQKTGDTTLNVMQNNSSRWGVKGSEDLGGGLKAGFQLESGLSPDTGAAAGTYWGRQSEVNLGGGFGTLRLGNFTSEAYYATADYVSNHNHDTGTSDDAFYAYIGRNANKVAYRAPEFLKGLSLEGAVALKEASNPNHSFDLAANYSVGDLALGLGYEKNGDVKQFAVRAFYSAGPFGFGGYVQRDTDGFGAGMGNRTTVRLSGMYTVGASEFHLNVGAAGKYSEVNDSAAKQFTLGYNYNLSKRTKVYGFYTKVDNDTAATYRTGTAGVDFSSIALGLRHNF
jgi:predicted porin